MKKFLSLSFIAALLFTSSLPALAKEQTQNGEKNQGHHRGFGCMKKGFIMGGMFDRILGDKESIQDKVLVNKAHITEINGNTIKIKIEDKDYTIDASSAKIVCQAKGVCDISKIKVGDRLNAIGTRGENDTIKAEHIVVFTEEQMQKIEEKMNNSSVGEIKSVDEANKTVTVETNNHGEQTIKVNEDTKIYKKPHEESSFSDLQIGKKIWIKGVWDKVTNAFSKITRIIISK